MAVTNAAHHRIAPCGCLDRCMSDFTENLPSGPSQLQYPPRTSLRFAIGQTMGQMSHRSDALEHAAGSLMAAYRVIRLKVQSAPRLFKEVHHPRPVSSGSPLA